MPQTNVRKTIRQQQTETLGQRLGRFRREQSLTQAQLVERAGITIRMLSAYENDRARPPLAAIRSLAQALRVTVDGMLADSAIPDTPPPPRRTKSADVSRSSNRKTRTDGFGSRLAAIRKAKGLTQDDLGHAIGLSQRMIAYYEAQNGNPPVSVLPEIAKALDITTDELLGHIQRENSVPESVRLWKRFKRVEALPPRKRQDLLRLIDTFIDSEQSTKPTNQ